MSSPIVRTPLGRVAAAPNWVLYLLAIFAVTATTMVAGHRHAGSDAPTATPDTAPAPVAASAPPQREQPVSRSASRREPRVLARAGAVTRAHRRERTVRPRAHRREPVVRPRALQRKPAPPRRPALPVAPRNAAETVAAAKSSTVNATGQCLAWSRQQAGIPAKYPDAATAWRHATARRPESLNPPRGAAVYWTGGSHGYGHIAISLGNGRVRSSDAGGLGEVGTVPIRRLSAEWHLNYAGWAPNVNGYRIPGVAGA